MENIFNGIFKELGYDINVKIIKSNKGFDFQCDDLFKLAKVYSKSPMMIGEEFIDKINQNDYSDYFKEVTLANPGFININVSDVYINTKLNELMDKDILGSTKENKVIVVDYGGPNVAKPLHVGHLRPAIIGQAIYNLLKFKGNKVIGDVHLGDIGTQMGQVIYGILEDFPGVSYEDINFDLDYLNKTYPRMSALCKENDEIKEKCALITKKLQEGDPDYRVLWKKICEISVKDIKRIYDYLDVHFDLWYGESDSFKVFDEMIEYFNEKNILKEDDGALVIDVKEDGDKVVIPPCLIQKSNGAYLYATSDLGTIWQRAKDYNPDLIIYVVDARQSMHFTQIFRATKKSHMYEGNLEHYGFGTMNGKDGKPFKTRTGGALKLEDLIKNVQDEFVSLREENKMMDKEDLDKIVNAIIKFADLQNDLERNYIFDVSKFSEVNGKTGPYILYTYLRINKLLEGKYTKLSKIYGLSDRNLRLKLLEVSNVIDISSAERKPHHLANYLYELCVIANNFYQANKLSEVSGDKKEEFETVLTFNNKVIKTLLGILGISIPKMM